MQTNDRVAHRPMWRTLGAVLICAVTLCEPSLAQSARDARAPAEANAQSAQSFANLSEAERSILAPLADDWTSLSETSKSKWRQIAKKYPTLAPEEQARLQERMRDWATAPSEQRRNAREHFQLSKSIPHDKKVQAWEDYQKLPDEQKQELAERARAKKPSSAVSVLPTSKPDLVRMRANHHPQAVAHPTASAPAPNNVSVAPASDVAPNP